MLNGKLSNFKYVPKELRIMPLNVSFPIKALKGTGAFQLLDMTGKVQ